MSRDGDDAVIRVEAPGLDVHRDVTVEVDQNRLVVRGERRDERAEQRAGRDVREVRYGRFERSWTLPEHVTADAVSATYDSGVLTVRVAGAHATPPEHAARRITVTADSSAADAPAVSDTPDA